MSSRAQDDDLVIGLMQEALALPAPGREAFVRGACEGDEDLFREVWRYVTAEERMKGFLTRPLLERKPPPRRLEPGELLDGRFRILRLAAEGGMGLVYEALDEKLDRHTALKFAKPGFRQRLSPEVRNAQEIAHPNVCKIFEIHTMTLDGETMDFVTMEFIEGPTLAERLTQGPLPRIEAEDIAQQICAGLAEAHRQRVVHGDLKSSNIMLTHSVGGGLRVVITDFGMARTASTKDTDEVGGTPDYMAPELWEGEKTSTASDVYALGVLLYELASGQRPYPSEPAPATSAHVAMLLDVAQSKANVPALEAGRVPHRPKPAHVYRKWDALLARCLDSNPSRRFASAVEVANALKATSRRRFLAFGGAGAAAVGIGWSLVQPGNSPTIAILPFTNAAPSAENQYLASGVSDALIHSLAQLASLRVVARSSSFRVAAESVDLRQAARLLGATALLTGRITEKGSHLDITVELVRADGTVLWGTEYHPSLADLPDVQAQMSAEVARRMVPSLPQADKLKLTRGARTNPDAFALLLRGRYQMQLYTPESKVQAAEYFEQALGIDPTFALANVELANAYRRLAAAGLLKPAEAVSRATRAVQRAIAADPDLAEAHAVLADTKKDEWDWASAEQEYRRALQLSPSMASARHGFAIFLSIRGKRNEALAELKQAADLDPIGLTNAVDSSAALYNLRLYDRALESLNKALQRDGTAPSIWTWTGIAHGGRHDFARALDAFQKSAAFGDTTSGTLCYAIHAQARLGQTSKAKAQLDKLQRSGEILPGCSLAIALVGLGQSGRALDALEASFAARDSLMQYIGVESYLDNLRGQARFQTLLAKLGLPLNG